MLSTLLLSATLAGSVPPVTSGDEFPYLTAADRFRERYELGDDPEAISLDEFFAAHYVKVQLGVFEVWMSANELSDKGTASDFKKIAAALVEAQGTWLDWIKPATDDIAEEEKDLKTLASWVKSWRPSQIASEFQEGGLDLLDAHNVKPKVIDAAHRVASSLGRGLSIGVDREQATKVPLVLVEDRAEFVEFVCFVGWHQSNFQEFYWKADVGNWTQFFVADYKVIALQYPVTSNKREHYDSGTSMNSKAATGLQQQVVQLAMSSFIDETLGGTAPEELINGMGINMVIDQFGEASARVDGSLKARKTNAFSVFVPGGNSSGGVLPGFSAESRWREDKGQDHFTRVLRGAQKDGYGSAKKPGNRVAYFRLLAENEVDRSVIEGPFYGAGAADFQLPPEEYLDDYSEFMRAYRCAFVHWLKNKSSKSKKASHEKFALLIRDMAHTEGMGDFGALLEDIYELPLSSKPIGKDSLEGTFLAWLSKQ